MMQSTTTIRSLKEKQRQEREELILQAAEEMLAEKGYHETSMDEIAARVGIAKGTVYLHFPSKEDLVVALYEGNIQKMSQAVEAILSSELTARAKLEQLLQFIYGGFFSRKSERFYSIYHQAELQRIFADKKAYKQGVWEQLSARISSLLDEGKANGEFDATIPTPVMLSTFLSLLSPRSYERLITEGKMSSDELIKHLSRLYFKSIAAM
jgi:TetR/AcrR family transcriptional regulator, fatty acid metabolism regulator protein